jgi:hypothetical protein
LRPLIAGTEAAGGRSAGYDMIPEHSQQTVYHVLD